MNRPVGRAVAAGAALPEPVKSKLYVRVDKAWVKPMTETDSYLNYMEAAMGGSSLT